MDTSAQLCFIRTTTTETHSVTTLYCPVVSKHAPTAKASGTPSNCYQIKSTAFILSCPQILSSVYKSMQSSHTICMQRVPEYSTGNFDLLHTNFKSVIKMRPEIRLARVQFTSDVFGTKCNGAPCRSPRLRNSKLFFSSSQMVKRPGLLR